MSDHCRICHQDFTDPSFGGPGICPACDCGIPPDVTRLQRTVAALTAENERLTRLNAELCDALDPVGRIERALEAEGAAPDHAEGPQP